MAPSQKIFGLLLLKWCILARLKGFISNAQSSSYIETEDVSVCGMQVNILSVIAVSVA